MASISEITKKDIKFKHVDFPKYYIELWGNPKGADYHYIKLTDLDDAFIPNTDDDKIVARLNEMFIDIKNKSHSNLNMVIEIYGHFKHGEEMENLTIQVMLRMNPKNKPRCLFKKKLEDIK